MSGFFGICGVALVGGTSALILAEISGRSAFSVKLVTLVVITAFVVASSRGLLSELSALVGEGERMARYYGIVIKALGIALIAHLTSGICKDCGALTVATAVESAAKLEIFVLCFPLVRELIGYASQMLLWE